MSKFYFTFGSGHHDTHGRSLLGYYVEIEAKDYMSARTSMFNHFGDKWAFQYDESQYEEAIAKYNAEPLSIDGVELCCGIEQSEYLELKEKVSAS